MIICTLVGLVRSLIICVKNALREGAWKQQRVYGHICLPSIGYTGLKTCITVDVMIVYGHQVMVSGWSYGRRYYLRWDPSLWPVAPQSELDFIDSVGSTRKTSLSSEQEKLIKEAMDQDATDQDDNRSRSFNHSKRSQHPMDIGTRNKQTRGQHEDSHIKAAHQEAEIVVVKNMPCLDRPMSLQHTRVEGI